MEKSENTGLFSDFFYQLRFGPAVRQCRSSGSVSRRSAGGKEIFMNIVGVFDFSRSVWTADHPCDWQRRAQMKLQTVGLPAAVLCLPAMQCLLQTHSPCRRGDEHRRYLCRSRSPSAVFAVVDLHRQDRRVPYGIRAKQVLI